MQHGETMKRRGEIVMPHSQFFLRNFMLFQRVTQRMFFSYSASRSDGSPFRLPA